MYLVQQPIGTIDYFRGRGGGMGELGYSYLEEDHLYLACHIYIRGPIQSFES